MCAKLYHEIRKGQRRKPFSVDGDPVVDKVVFETAEDAGDLDIIFNPTFCIDEVVEAVVFKVFDRLGSDLTI